MRWDGSIHLWEPSPGCTNAVGMEDRIPYLGRSHIKGHIWDVRQLFIIEYSQLRSRGRCVLLVCSVVLRFSTILNEMSPKLTLVTARKSVLRFGAKPSTTKLIRYQVASYLREVLPFRVVNFTNFYVRCISDSDPPRAVSSPLMRCTLTLENILL